MASGEFLELAQQAAYRSRFTIAGDDITRAKEAINEAYLYICDCGERWTWLEKEGTFTISSTSDVYTLASIATALAIDGIKEVYAVIDDTTGGMELTPLDWTSLENISRSTQDDDLRGRPECFTVFDSRIRFYPWPDTTYEIGIICEERDAAMSGDTDPPKIPLEWRHALLVPYAAANLLEIDSGSEALNQAQYYRSLFEGRFELFKVRYASARLPQLGLQSPMFAYDLPGSTYYE